jgi:hypothetical protein
VALTKQEFYEGAALHRLARTGRITAIRYEPPLFVINNSVLVHLKYSTKKKSPWSFSFTADERSLLAGRSANGTLVIGLICGSDGVAAIGFNDFSFVAGSLADFTHIACYRDHGKHYEVRGPEGSLSRKVPPSNWLRSLGDIDDE